MASSEVQTQTNCYIASHQCNRPDLLENRMVKLRSVCVCGDWWFSIPGLCQCLCVCGLSILAVILIKGNEKPNRIRQEKGSKYR